jgi:glutamine cyclotransferase
MSRPSRQPNNQQTPKRLLPRTILQWAAPVIIILLGYIIYQFALLGTRMAPPAPAGETSNNAAEAVSSPLSATASRNDSPLTSASQSTGAVIELEITQADIVSATGEIPVYTYEVINTYPHDVNAFTQGLVWDGDILYEGTGLNGRSSLRRVDLESGQVLQQLDLPTEYFGEGITVWGEQIVQLTWQSQRGFVYNKETFEQLAEFTYPTQGWGITHDSRRLIMSDGSATIYFWDPNTFTAVDTINVYDLDGPVASLNELEYINGEIWANIWQTDRIARIDPVTGQVLAWVDLSGLLTPAERAQADVLNGIAYKPDEDRLFVTGKLWPKLFEIRLVAMAPE